MKGFRTIIGNVVLFIGSLAGVIGGIEDAEIAAITTGVLAAYNIAMRFVTTTAVFRSENDHLAELAHEHGLQKK